MAVEFGNSFCRGCMTNSAWAPGSLCNTCMLRESLEKQNQQQQTHVPSSYSAYSTEDKINAIGEFIGGIGTLVFFGWLISLLF